MGFDLKQFNHKNKTGKTPASLYSFSKCWFEPGVGGNESPLLKVIPLRTICPRSFIIL